MKKFLSRGNFYSAILLICIGVLLTSCATQPTTYANDVPGFFSGIFHGLLAPFALIGSIFADIRIYEFPNSGWWYDFGFIIGMVLLFS